MRRRTTTALVLAGLAVTLTGCSMGAGSGASPASSGSTGISIRDAESGTDVGDGRPHVSYDGLMVRRRVVVAVHPAPGADLARIRAVLDRRAAARHLDLSDVSPDVLDAAELAHEVPPLIVALPIGQPLSVGDEIAYPAGAVPVPGVDHFHVDSVLVHDLEFDLATLDPVRVGTAIDREGILSDALGLYSAGTRPGLLRITYTGPLLSDELVHRVQGGIARGAHTRPALVRVRPRSSTGTGVDMAKEPAQPVADEPLAEEHAH